MHKWKLKDPVIIVPYGGYANDKIVHIYARVLEDEGIILDPGKHLLKNVSNFYKRLASDEIKNASIKLSWPGKSLVVKSDKEGYIQFSGSHGLSSGFYQNPFVVKFELIKNGQVSYSTHSFILTPSPHAPFGVISDMDDTVIQTGVSSIFKWRLLINSMFRDSHSRLPLSGASEFYQKLSKEKGEVPFFYLSNSPWNLYDYLASFLKRQLFPKGILLLRDFGWHTFKRKHFTKKNKYLTIVQILETYPSLPFVLIGDAAEIDTEIYLSLATSFPSQVKAIYIRGVNKEKKDMRVKKLIENITHTSVRFIHTGEEALAFAKEDDLIH